MNSNWTILSKLIFCLVYLSNEVCKCLTIAGHTDLWPLSVLELTNSTRDTIPRISNLELSKCVCWHVVLNHRIDHEVLIPG